MVIAARAAGIEPMDAVFMDFRNLDALRTECELARRLGCVGKVAIHPMQLPVIHEVFTPSEQEVEHHRRILRLFDQALESGSASLSIDGQMVDYAVARQSRSVLARAGVAAEPPL
jgi:citrate lyase subunit beta/citryl-CoA lyase